MKYLKITIMMILLSINLTGCEMFPNRFLEPKEPGILTELVGSWDIQLIDGVSLQAATEATYAEWYFDIDGHWLIYAAWDYGPISVEAYIKGYYELDGNDIVLYIDDDYGLFGIDPGESLLKGTLHFDGEYLTFNEQGDDEMYMEIVMQRLHYEYYDGVEPAEKAVEPPEIEPLD